MSVVILFSIGTYLAPAVLRLFGYLNYVSRLPGARERSRRVVVSWEGRGEEMCLAALY